MSVTYEPGYVEVLVQRNIALEAEVARLKAAHEHVFVQGTEQAIRAGQAEAKIRENPIDVRDIQVECHSNRDIKVSLHEAWTKLPICPLLTVVTGAIQEIGALRAKAETKDPVPNDFLARLYAEASEMEAAMAGEVEGEGFHLTNWRDKPHRVVFDAIKLIRQAANRIADLEVQELGHEQAIEDAVLTEREACAQQADSLADSGSWSGTDEDAKAHEIARAIRGRGERFGSEPEYFAPFWCDEDGNTLYPYVLKGQVSEDGLSIKIHEPAEFAATWPSISSRYLARVDDSNPRRLTYKEVQAFAALDRPSVRDEFRMQLQANKGLDGNP